MIAHHLRRWRAPLGLLAGLSLLLVACGGGVGTGGTGSFASGPITGFGSVIVNDIVFDDSGAAVEDGDGGARTRAELRLGMTVEVDGEALQSRSARARSIRYDSALLGPIDAVDVPAGRFLLLGQTVIVDANTFFDDRLPGRLEGLAPGRWAEVYALYDPALQRYRATRVESRSALPPAYRLRGALTQLDSAARTFRIGAALFDYSAAAGMPVGLANGQFVRLKLQRAPLANGAWSVEAFSAAQSPVGDLDDVVVKGLVTSLGSASAFDVDGRPVDASGARIEGVLQLGARVEVEGEVRAGVLRARRVEVRSDDDERMRGFELRGPVESVNPAQQRFVLRGVTVSTRRSDLRYENGSAADLVPGRRVGVKGLLDGSGTALEAMRIKFE
jgi:hypothetical protein